MQKATVRPERLRALTAALGALTLALLAVGWGQTARLNRAADRINAVYKKAFYETCELTEAMSVNLRKLLVAGDSGRVQQILGDVSRQAQGASGDLALLPIGEETVSSTLKFINQVGDFSETLSVRIASGGAISDADYAAIAQMSENAALFTVGMSRLLERVERGEISLDDAQSARTDDYAPLSNTAADYPTLLYDGPFSDGADGETFLALDGLADVSADEAQQRLTAFLGGVTQIKLTGEGSIPVDCYEFSLTANGYPLSAGVTKRGGEVLYVLCETGVDEGALPVSQMLDAAQAFLLSRGYGNMEMSYYSSYGGILTVNYAAVQNGVVLYPDLVKVQLSMKDGAIVGLEAANYLQNHVSRTIELPALSQEEAAARLGARLTAQSVRLCIIPTDSGEALCYEMRATDGTDTFLVYIDAATGAERELMQVVSDENGALVM